jgi:hypothetical protein
MTELMRHARVLNAMNVDGATWGRAFRAAPDRGARWVRRADEALRLLQSEHRTATRRLGGSRAGGSSELANDDAHLVGDVVDFLVRGEPAQTEADR